MDTAAPLVSVGIPTRNRPELLAARLENVLAQTYSNIEIIVSDDASDDPAVAHVLEQYSHRDSRIKVHVQGESVGAHENLRYVLTAASGEYFAWAADDDSWDPTFLSSAVGKIGSAALYVGAMSIKDATGVRGASLSRPALSSKKSPSENVALFLRNMQPAFFRGVHKTAALKRTLPEKPFDLYASWTVLDAILHEGVEVGSGGACELGAASPIDDSQRRPFSYRQFMLRSWRSIASTVGLSSGERARLAALLAVAVERHVARVVIEKPAAARWYHKHFAGSLGSIRTARHAWRRAFVDRFSGRSKKSSYSQSGEDLIVDFALAAMGIRQPSYLDIGANHPFRMSNTYSFYRRGCRGVAVEPDPQLHRLFAKSRPRDVCLNVGISDQERASAPFYVMSEPTLNTFSEEEAKRYESLGSHRISAVVNVPLVSVSNLFETYFPSRSPDFLSLDVEGLDTLIVQAIDFDTVRPAVMCIETLSYDENLGGQKELDLIELIISKGYIHYADTHINSIFIDGARWGGTERDEAALSSSAPQ